MDHGNILRCIERPMVTTEDHSKKPPCREYHHGHEKPYHLGHTPHVAYAYIYIIGTEKINLYHLISSNKH
jgi:hypothetical protein